MSNAKCRRAIEARLYGWASTRDPVLRVAFENDKFTPTGPDETYLRGFLLPADTGSETLQGEHRRYTGVYQIDVMSPITIGAGAGEAILDEISTLYPMNVRITVAGLTVQVVSPVSAGPAQQDEGHFVLPTYFNYRADYLIPPT